MKKFKLLSASHLGAFVGCAALALLVGWPLMSPAQDKSGKAKETGNQALASQISDLTAKVARLEAALKQNQKGTTSGTPDLGGLADKQDNTGGDSPDGRVSAKFQNCVQCHQTRPSGALPPSHLEMGGGIDKGTKQDAKTGTGDNKAPADVKAGMGGKDMGMGKMGEKKAAGMGVMEEKKGMAGMGGGKDMGMGMGMMGEKKAAGMGMMEEKKGMAGMGSTKAGMGGPTTGTMDQQMKLKVQMMELKLQKMELKLQMMEKGAGTGTDQAAPDLHAGHTGTPPDTAGGGAKVGVQDKTPDLGNLTDNSSDTGTDLPAQVRELQARIANLEAALKTRP